MVAKKLLGDDKITAWAKKYVSWVLNVRFRMEKHLYCQVKYFAFLKSVKFPSIFKFYASSNLSFLYELLIGSQLNFSECIVLFL